MGLFSKKPGGTFFGNLLRTVAKQASGGTLGSGANRIELGQTQTNADLAAGSSNILGQGGGSLLSSSAGGVAGTSAVPGGTLLDGIKNVLNNGLTQNVKTDPTTIILVAGGILAVILLTRKKGR